MHNRDFRMFFQDDESNTRKYAGTAWLAICRQRVEMMNGRIGVESAVGKAPVLVRSFR